MEELLKKQNDEVSENKSRLSRKGEDTEMTMNRNVELNYTEITLSLIHI